jgi:SAM-dependent methyltransferase
VRHGFRATVRRGVIFCSNKVNAARPSARRRSRERAHVDRVFDESLGIDTSKLRVTSRNDAVGQHWAGGQRYEALDPRFDFGAALSALDIAFDEFVFVDVGAGMGRGLFIASQLPFKRIVGVEYSAELVRIAHENIRAAESIRPGSIPLEVVHADALEYELPNDSLLPYLFNPFDKSVMTKYVKHVQASYEAAPRRIVVVYLNPRHAELWQEARCFEHVRGWGGASIFDTGPRLLCTASGNGRHLVG